MIRVVTLAGPTASGKTAAALELAQRLDGEIVSCDSLAVYRGCDVGTAKPSAGERARVPHHLLDVADADERFSAADFVRHADRAIADIAARGRVPIVAGGTGLYLRALVFGLFPSPPPDPELRAALRSEAAQGGWPTLHARLAALDPEAAARIHPTDPVRIERALEVHAQTGETISALQRRHREASPPRYRAFALHLDPGAAALDERIARRVSDMIERGLVDETRALAARWGRAIKPLGAVGYKEALLFLDGGLPEAALAPAIVKSTRHFARRQRTWFAKEDAIRIEDARALPWDAIRAFIEA